MFHSNCVTRLKNQTQQTTQMILSVTTVSAGVSCYVVDLKLTCKTHDRFKCNCKCRTKVTFAPATVAHVSMQQKYFNWYFIIVAFPPWDYLRTSSPTQYHTSILSPKKYGGTRRHFRLFKKRFMTTRKHLLNCDEYITFGRRQLSMQPLEGDM